MILEGIIILIILTIISGIISIIAVYGFDYTKIKFKKKKTKIDNIKTKEKKVSFNRDDLSKIAKDAKFSKINTNVIINMIEDEMLRLARNKETSMDMKIVIREIPMGSIDFDYIDNLFSNDKKFKENFRITKNPGNHVDINVYAWW